ncbi:MAG: nitroreductase family protein [Deltaproteobacteria bacterium]|nr:nitroreductase family protein [Deltaproteobacteria bacterium]
MAELMEILKQRRSIRKFQEKALPDGLVEDVLESVRWSPSWANTQCWEVVVVKDPVTKEALAETLGKTNPARKAILKAPVVLALCARLKQSGYYKGKAVTKFGDWFMFDMGIASQSLCLAACDHGLGTVIVGMLDHDKAGEILGVKEGCEVVALIPLGYPDQDPPAPKRRSVGEFIHFERF